MSVKTGYAGGDIRRGDIIKIVDGKPDLEPAEPERRYERESPGEIIHIDIKKLGVSSVLATASPEMRAVRTGAAALGGTSSTASTTILALLSRRSNRTRRRTALFCFSKRLWLVTKALELPSRAS